jgi:hypothetical protein
MINTQSALNLLKASLSAQFEIKGNLIFLIIDLSENPLLSKTFSALLSKIDLLLHDIDGKKIPNLVLSYLVLAEQSFIAKQDSAVTLDNCLPQETLPPTISEALESTSNS